MELVLATEHRGAVEVRSSRGGEAPPAEHCAERSRDLPARRRHKRGGVRHAQSAWSGPEEMNETPSRAISKAPASGASCVMLMPASAWTGDGGAT